MLDEPDLENRFTFGDPGEEGEQMSQAPLCFPLSYHPQSFCLKLEVTFLGLQKPQKAL